MSKAFPGAVNTLGYTLNSKTLHCFAGRSKVCEAKKITSIRLCSGENQRVLAEAKGNLAALA